MRRDSRLLLVVSLFGGLACAADRPADPPSTARLAGPDEVAPVPPSAGHTCEPPVGRDTPVPGCTKFDTLGGADRFFAARCGSASACHDAAGGVVWIDLTRADLYLTLLDRRTNATCVQDRVKLIDSADWRKSALLFKSVEEVPACPSGAAGSIPGTTMPPPPELQALTEKVPPLDDDEKDCIEAFVKAATGS